MASITAPHFTPVGVLIGLYVAAALYGFCRDCKELWERRQASIRQHCVTVEVD
ncbi:MAG: hypothetical protein JOZ57_00385 [Abitibacteriaceae bacterium]|nr:hypothetical protein [Abditibacteriaceae bacterium]